MAASAAFDEHLPILMRSGAARSSISCNIGRGDREMTFCDRWFVTTSSSFPTRRVHVGGDYHADFKHWASRSAVDRGIRRRQCFVERQWRSRRQWRHDRLSIGPDLPEQRGQSRHCKRGRRLLSHQRHRLRYGAPQYFVADSDSAGHNRVLQGNISDLVAGNPPFAHHSLSGPRLGHGDAHRQSRDRSQQWARLLHPRPTAGEGRLQCRSPDPDHPRQSRHRQPQWQHQQFHRRLHDRFRHRLDLPSTSHRVVSGASGDTVARTTSIRSPA